MPPLHSITHVPHSRPGVSKAWVISHGFTDAHGRAIPGGLPNSCFNGQSISTACLVNHHVYQSSIYERARRFWPLQGAEAGIFTALSVAFLGLAVGGSTDGSPDQSAGCNCCNP